MQYTQEFNGCANGPGPSSGSPSITSMRQFGAANFFANSFQIKFKQ
jgi:hypothetical protein